MRTTRAAKRMALSGWLLVGSFCAAGLASAATVPETRKVRLWLGVDQGTQATQAPRGLTTADLLVLAGGTPVPSSELELISPRARAAGEPPQVAIYFDLALAKSGTLRTAASDLAELAQQLSELGEVTIVVAGAEPKEELSTREVAVLKERLVSAAASLEGGDEILAGRAALFAELEQLDPAARTSAVVSRALERERAQVERRLDLLVSWAGAHRNDRPRVVFWVQDGFDVDPLAFYRGALADELTRDLPTNPAVAGTAEQAASALAASGWTVVPLTPRPEVETKSAVVPTAIFLGDPMGQEPPPGGLGIKIRPGRVARWWRERRAGEGPPEPRLLDPAAGLAMIAEAGGGRVAASAEALGAELRGFLGRYELSFPAPATAGEVAIEVRSRRPGLYVRSRRFWSSGTPLGLTAARLRRLLAGDELPAPLDLEALLRLEKPGGLLPHNADLELLLGLADADAAEGDTGEVADRAALTHATVAVTLAATTPKGASPSFRRLLAPQDLRDFRSWHHRFSAELPIGASDLAMIVELVGTELWGGARVEGVVIEPEDRDKNLLTPVKQPAP